MVVDDDAIELGRIRDGRVDEEGLDGGNRGDSYPDDGDMRGARTETSRDLNIRWGADDGESREVTFVDAEDQAALLALDLHSDGDALSYDINDAGTVLTATAGEGVDERVVFTVTLKADGSGSYDFELLDNLDHPDANTEDNLDLEFEFIATDGDKDSVSGEFTVVVDDDALVIGETIEEYTVPSFTVSSFDDVSSAGYQNSYGYYIKNDQGNPVKGFILEDNVKDRDGLYENPITVTGYGPEQVGFFIIPNGGWLNRNHVEDGEEVTFEFTNGEWQAFTQDGTPLNGAGSKVLFDVAALNKDGQDHVEDNELDGNQNWEDFQIPAGDSDYNDVNTNVEWDEVTVLGSFVDEEGLAMPATHDDGFNGDIRGTTLSTGGNLNISWGADDGEERSVNFGDVVLPEGLSSNGEAVEYSFNDARTLLTATAGSRVVFTVELSDEAAGSYHFTLFDNMDHSPLGDTEDDLVLDFEFVATDTDGDSATSAFSVTIDDDAPVITTTESQDKDYEFTASNYVEDTSASYSNSYGYYVKDEQGNPVRGVILEDNVKDRDGLYENPETITGYSPEQIGFFIIPNGGWLNRGSVENGEEVTFEFINGEWQAFTQDGTPLNGAGSKVLFDEAALNKDGQDHVEDNELDGNQNWEDFQIPGDDGDYNDGNTNVDWTEVSVSGDTVGSVAFGADGEGSLDFTFDESDILVSGSITSNGKAVTFEAKDSDNDGHNDQIVGVTEDDTEVLTIEGVLDGDYNVSVLGPIDDNQDASVDITAHVAATDGDGDTAYQDLSININVDVNHLLTTSSVEEF